MLSKMTTWDVGWWLYNTGVELWWCNEQVLFHCGGMDIPSQVSYVPPTDFYFYVVLLLNEVDVRKQDLLKGRIILTAILQ